MTKMRPPSGNQATISFGDQKVTTTSVGGGLRRYTKDETEVVEGFEENSIADSTRGQTMIPWPNRIRGARYHWAGKAYQLDLSEARNNNAIHGLTRWQNFELVRSTQESVTYELFLPPTTSWPFMLLCQIRYDIGEAGLRVETTIKNIGDTPAPLATGAHPYISLFGEKIDQLKLQSPAHSYFEKDDQAIPIAKKEVEDTIYDFRKNKKIASVALDHTFSDIDRDKDGLARITLSNDTDSKTTLWMDESYQYLQLYSGDTLPDAKRRRHSIAIEPMSAPPDAFNSGVDLIKLEPEETKSFTWGIEPNLIKS
ncbi:MULTISPECIES: aldose 1-epimerase family protein [Acidithrix]|uniref:Aldose 1-epimerase n=1 Tax=Acidithrix ferrooxidans TaxID=1280514 RepID=A0A0D8HL63_9ACTN|nr:MULTISPECIES: aldose 1-epimerase family protein [Acidithrix]KJF18745.1 aldose 1-epimerase [Acidithrix ferrooxidans]CAG4931722.1 unnamed protein product [Acidithrix sp. C25]